MSRNVYEDSFLEIVEHNVLSMSSVKVYDCFAQNFCWSLKIMELADWFIRKSFRMLCLCKVISDRKNIRIITCCK